MSAWREAVAELNRKFKDDGWRSAPHPEIPCEKCKQERCIVLSTIHGRTTAACDCCGHHWEIA